MSEPIIETIAASLKSRLETITIVNGYTMDIGEVLRPASLANPDYANLQAILFQGADEPIDGSYGHDTHNQEFFIGLILRPGESETTSDDTAANRFGAAIRRCLLADQTWAALAINFDILGPESLPPESTLEGAQMRVMVMYRTLENDPYTQ